MGKFDIFGSDKNQSFSEEGFSVDTDFADSLPNEEPLDEPDSVSKQVVIFPLLGKELSEEEYNALLPNVNRVYVIENKEGCSSFKNVVPNKLFETLS